jgi:hypothetical protein
MSQSKLTFQEIIDKLQNSGVSISEFAYECTSGLVTPELSELGECNQVHQKGGEGQGDHWESVKYFPEHDIYIKVTGYYQSYNGTEFYGGYKDCCSEVRPKEKTIIVYE